MTDPAHLVREACDLLAGYLPQLEQEIPEPGSTGAAVPGMAGRAPAAPLPGNAAALYARTGIEASARNLEGMLLYAAGRRRPGPLSARGGSDANTLAALDAISRLFATVEGEADLERLVMSELDRRLDAAREHPAIDEAQRWRPVPSRQCPTCRCWFLRVLLDSRGDATTRVDCFGHLPSGAPCRAVAAMGTDEHGRPALTWADGFTETVTET